MACKFPDQGRRKVEVEQDLRKAKMSSIDFCSAFVILSQAQLIATPLQAQPYLEACVLAPVKRTNPT